MKRCFLVLFFLLIATNIIISYVFAAPDDVGLVISIDKHIYKVNEIINVSFMFKNDSQKVIGLVWSKFLIRLLIKNEQGEEYCVWYSYPKTLLPEGFTELYNYDDYYKINDYFLLKPKQVVYKFKDFRIGKNEFDLDGRHISNLELSAGDEFDGIFEGSKFVMKAQYVFTPSIMEYGKRWYNIDNFYDKSFESNQVEFKVN